MATPILPSTQSAPRITFGDYVDVPGGYVYGNVPTSNYASYNMCTIAKETFIDHYPDGGGGHNSLGLDCSNYSMSYAESTCTPGFSCLGYPELINYGPTGSFWGAYYSAD